jgi:hypothetical protein
MINWGNELVGGGLGLGLGLRLVGHRDGALLLGELDGLPAADLELLNGFFSTYTFFISSLR